MQKLTRSLAMASALAFAGVLAGCGDDVTVKQPTTVTVTPSTATVRVGETVQLTASVTGDVADKTVTWSSSDQAKATVDANGKVTAVARGNATITAKSNADAAATSSALITITGAGVNQVTVAPSNAIIKPGDFLQATAQVDADPGVARTVTWSSSATSVATVDNTGKITAVAQGTATITAASTADPSVTGSLALTVRPLQTAQISIKSVTQGGTNNPVNFNNVQGQVDIVLNLDPGDQVVTKVEVLLDGQTACSQNLSVQQSQELSLAAVFPDVQAAEIVCSINTAAFNPATGAVTYLNGVHQLTAKATIGGTQPGNVATPSQALTFNNQSGFIAAVSNTNTVGGPASAINPNTGLKWVQGDVTLKLTAVNYTAGGATVSQVSGSFLGKNFTATNPTGQVFTVEFKNSATAALAINNYQTPVPSAQSIPQVNGSTLSTGSSGPTQVLNAGAKADSLGLPRLDSTRVDNVAPAAPTVGSMPIWLNAAFNFDTTSTAVTAVTDAGVDNVTTEFYYIAGNLPTSACSTTGMTKVTSASALVETTVSSSYRGRIVIKDALGNTTCANLAPGGTVGGQFGADFTAPTLTLTAIAGGVADSAGVTAQPAAFDFSLAASDNASGFNSATAVTTTLKVTTATGTTCVVGTSSNGCTATEALNAATAGSATEGYYTATYVVKDQAGNAATTVSRFYLFDATVPAFSGGLSLQSLYTGNQPASFQIAVSDNLDLNKLSGVVTYVGVDSIAGPTQSLGTFGLPLERTATANYTINNFIACLTASGSFAAGTKASQLGLTLTDQANNSAAFGAAGNIPASNVANCSTVGNTGFAAGGFTQSAPNYGTGKTQVDISGTSLATASSATVALTAVADVPLNTTENPFNTVNFYYRPTASSPLVLIGTATATLSQTVSNRTYTYTLTWDPDAAVPAGTIPVVAIGIDKNGNGVLTNAQNVTTVP
jgi:hypothetical protein